MKKFNNAGFSIIEIMVGVFIFTLGLLSVFLMLQSSVNMNNFSRNEIIAANLAREGLELVKNTRDTNFDEYTSWKLINPNNYDSGDSFEVGKYYKIENNFGTDSQFSVNTSEIEDFEEGENFINSKMQNYRLYLDNNGIYTYNSGLADNNEKTHFYRYIKIEKADYTDFNDENKVVSLDEDTEGFRIISKVIWTSKGYHEVELRTIITNWKKL